MFLEYVTHSLAGVIVVVDVPHCIRRLLLQPDEGMPRGGVGKGTKAAAGEGEGGGERAGVLARCRLQVIVDRHCL